MSIMRKVRFISTFLRCITLFIFGFLGGDQPQLSSSCQIRAILHKRRSSIRVGGHQ